MSALLLGLTIGAAIGTLTGGPAGCFAGQWRAERKPEAAVRSVLAFNEASLNFALTATDRHGVAPLE